VFDGQNSVRHLVDESELITDSYSYDAYGNITELSGVTENSFMYRAEQFDIETGNYYLRARYYSPISASFISVDPYVGDMANPISLNKYLYGSGNSVMFSDPSGLTSMAEMNATMVIANILGNDYSLSMFAHAANISVALKTYEPYYEIRKIGMSLMFKSSDLKAFKLGLETFEEGNKGIGKAAEFVSNVRESMNDAFAAMGAMSFFKGNCSKLLDLYKPAKLARSGKMVTGFNYKMRYYMRLHNHVGGGYTDLMNLFKSKNIIRYSSSVDVKRVITKVTLGFNIISKAIDSEYLPIDDFEWGTFH